MHTRQGDRYRCHHTDGDSEGIDSKGQLPGHRSKRTADAVESMDEKLTDIRDELKDRPALAFDS